MTDRPKRILIVEDESIVAADIKSCLNESGFEVTGIAASADDALEEMSAASPDLVLMDIRIQGKLDGIELADLLYGRYGAQVVYLTAHGDRETIERAKKTHPLGFVLKPFKSAELANAIEFAFEKAAADRRATERARELLESSEERFRKLVAVLPAGVYACDAPGAITFYNERAAELWGRRPRTGESAEEFCRLYRPDRRPLPYAESPMAVALAQRRTCRDERVLIERPDGSLLDSLFNAAPLTDSSGAVTGAIGAFIDMKALREADEKLAAAQRRLAFFDAGPDPLFTIGPDGRIAGVNEAAVQATGVGREQLIGTDFAKHFTDPNQAREAVRRTFAQGGVTAYPLAVRHRDGGQTHVLYNASVETDAFGNAVGVFAAARDVSAQRRAELELSEHRAKLEDRLSELERFQKITVGRELRMVELKKEIADLKTELADLKRKVDR